MSDATTRARLRRRLLLGGPPLAVAAVAGSASSAEAAPPGTAWALGGNANVSTNGSNYLGPRNAAPLVIKTTAGAGGTPTERMRVQPNGRVGIGTTAPASVLDVRGRVPDRGVVQGVNTSPFGYGVQGSGGEGTGGLFQGFFGVYGDGRGTNSVGIYGSGDTGVEGAGSTVGVLGSSTTGVRGTGTTQGVEGRGPVGVLGTGTGPQGVGVRATSNSRGVEATGVIGVDGTGSSFGVDGFSQEGVGVRGISNTSNGVVGHSNGDGAGVTGTGRLGVDGFGGLNGVGVAAEGGLRGLYARSEQQGEAGYFQGQVRVMGQLTKQSGSFRIDHPLDPDNRWLSHSFVESPDMMNVYNGNVTTDADGQATVELPDYFHALNRGFRYQLTVLGVFAQAIVARKIRGGSFDIRTDVPHVEVSWQVTGIRKDAWATAHPIVVDEPKVAKHRGTRAFVPSGSLARAMDHGPGSEVRHRDVARGPAVTGG